MKGVNRQESDSLRIDKRYVRLHWLIAALVETEHLQLPLLIPLLAIIYMIVAGNAVRSAGIPLVVLDLEWARL